MNQQYSFPREYAKFYPRARQQIWLYIFGATGIVSGEIKRKLPQKPPDKNYCSSWSPNIPASEGGKKNKSSATPRLTAKIKASNLTASFHFSFEPHSASASKGGKKMQR